MVKEVMPMSSQGNWQGVGMKEGLPYVRVPSAVLDSMVAVRLHLDGAPEGDLNVVPGSHTSDVDRIATWLASRFAFRICASELSPTTLPVVSCGLTVNEPIERD